jgi:5'-methylthioadenosine phosphorylase
MIKFAHHKFQLYKLYELYNFTNYYIMKIGIIGGSGLDNPNILADKQELIVETPYGSPSSILISGKIGNTDVVLLARHGREHTIPPTQVNFRANIHALKQVGCTHIIATTAVGSLNEKIGRGDLVILDQFIDFTHHRSNSFYDKFEPHNSQHTAMAEPFSAELRKLLIETCKNLKLKHHEQGTVITIEGPRFSTRAESKMFKSWGADVINMSIAPEAALANEANIPYAAVAMSTDYDSWKEDEETVTWKAVLKIFEVNVKNITNLLISAIAKLSENKTDSIKSIIRTVPNWPKPGVMFRDITTLLKDAREFNRMIDLLVERYQKEKIDVVAGIESRGFIIGSILAHRLNVGFIPIRKPGKLPAAVVAEEYELEYGKDKIEIHADAISVGAKILLADDLIATGGTALAACNLIKKLGGEIVECCLVVDLPELGGKKRLEQAGYKVFSLVEFKGL